MLGGFARLDVFAFAIGHLLTQTQRRCACGEFIPPRSKEEKGGRRGAGLA